MIRAALATLPPVTRQYVADAAGFVFVQAGLDGDAVAAPDAAVVEVVRRRGRGDRHLGLRAHHVRQGRAQVVIGGLEVAGLAEVARQVVDGDDVAAVQQGQAAFDDVGQFADVAGQG